jgi:hypothetical protein
MGVYASDFYAPTALVLRNSTLGPAPYAAVWLDGSGSYHLENNDLSGNTAYDLDGAPIHGNALFAERGVQAWDGTSGLLLEHNTLHDAEDVALLLDASSAVLDGNQFDKNGSDVVQQRCDTVSPLTAPDPSWTICGTDPLLTDWTLRYNALSLTVADAQ